MIYADWSYYVNNYFGDLIEANEYNRLATRASAYLDYYTMGKAVHAAETDSVKMACCAVAEQYKLVDKAQSNAVAGLESGVTGELKSETVGSWSQTYQSGGDVAKTALSAMRDAKAQLAGAAAQYLSGTGLLYRGGCT